MRYECIASGSDGNCHYLMADNGEILLLDVGIGVKAIKVGIDFQISKIAGALSSHGHSDHSLSVEALRSMGISVFAPYEDGTSTSVKFGDYFIQAFELTDADGNPTHTNGDGTPCPCYGFLITHAECGKFLYVTDTQLVKYRFKNLNHILLGVNYDVENVADDMNARVNHVLHGHMNIDTAREFIKTNANEGLKNVILCHLSTENASPQKFKESISSVCKCPVSIACKRLRITL